MKKSVKLHYITLTLLYTGYKMLGFTRGGAIMAPPLETSKNEATEACEGSN